MNIVIIRTKGLGSNLWVWQGGVLWPLWFHMQIIIVKLREEENLLEIRV